MTEAEWLAGTDPGPMLEFLKGRASDRKLRLFACAVCRRLAPIVGTDEYVRGIEAAESVADGGRAKAAMKRSRQALTDRRVALVGTTGTDQSDEWTALFLGTLALSDREYRASHTSLSDILSDRGSRPLKKIAKASCVTVRDIFGNPFRPVASDPRWRTADVTGLARAIYEDRAWDRMPVLADALMDAGCDSDDVLNHCRGEGPHARGCWVVDLVLGKG